MIWETIPWTRKLLWEVKASVEDGVGEDKISASGEVDGRCLLAIRVTIFTISGGYWHSDKGTGMLSHNIR